MNIVSTELWLNQISKIQKSNTLKHIKKEVIFFRSLDHACVPDTQQNHIIISVTVLGSLCQKKNLNSSFVIVTGLCVNEVNEVK